MKEFNLKSPYLNGFKDQDDSALAYVNAYNSIFDLISDGKMYVKFIKGDRAGSIAKVKFSEKVKNQEKTKIISFRSNFDWRFRFSESYFYLTCEWDKRSNKVQLQMPNYEAVFVLDYEGPTVWSLFDVKKAKAEALNNLDERDIDGKLLKVGDKVLYINARYGSGFTLNHGEIVEFKAVVDSKKKVITTVVKLDGSEMLSSIHQPENMVFLKCEN